MPPAKAIVKLAIPATLALLAKAVYNLVDTAYIGMLNSDIALTAVGVTVPLLLIGRCNGLLQSSNNVWLFLHELRNPQYTVPFCSQVGIGSQE